MAERLGNLPVCVTCPARKWNGEGYDCRPVIFTLQAEGQSVTKKQPSSCPTKKETNSAPYARHLLRRVLRK